MDNENKLEFAMRKSRVLKCCKAKRLPNNISDVCPFCYSDLSWMDGYVRGLNETQGGNE